MNAPGLVPASENLPLATQRVLLTLELIVLGIVVQAMWCAARYKLRASPKSDARHA